VANDFVLHAEWLANGSASISCCNERVWNALCRYALAWENEWLKDLTTDEAVLFVLFVGHAEGY